PRTDTWGNAGCGMSRKRQSHSCSDRIVRDECRAQRFGIGRYRAVPCAAGPRSHGSSAEGTVPGERGRHRLLPADVLSCSSVASWGGPDYADGQVVEWTRGGVKSGFRHVQISGSRLEVAMTKEQLNAAQIRARIEQMGSERVPQHVRAE